MKTKPFYLIILLLSLSCNKKDDPKTTPDIKKEVPSQAVFKKRVSHDNTFAFYLLQKTLPSSTSPNVVLSPISMSLALGMVWNGADNETKKEIERALFFKGFTVEEINGYYQYMQNTLLQTDSKTKVKIANSIWYRNGFPIYPDFLHNNTLYFDAEVHGLDFSQPSSVDLINRWCSKKTNNLIPKVLDKIPESTLMYLINAVYFKGIWQTSFDPKHTFETTFTNEDKQSTPVNMMNLQENLPYTEDLNAQYVDLPYGNGDYSMTIILPREGITTKEVLKNMTVDLWNSRLQQLNTQEIHLLLPRFKTKAHFDMKDPLYELGIKKAFHRDEADFSRLSPYKTCISKVTQDVFLEVTEEGTEAAATTVVGMNFTSGLSNNTIMVNKPFLFVIREQNTGIILFIGKMGNVEKY